MKFYYSTIRWDRKLETRGLFRCKICFRSSSSRQNGLNCHMEQNIFVWPKIQFFSFFPYWSPIGPLLDTHGCPWRSMGSMGVGRNTKLLPPWEMGPNAAQAPWGPKERPQRRAQRRAQRKGTIFIDGYPSMNSLMDVQQWVPMDFQFFEIQFFEKTMKNNEKPWKNNEQTMKKRWKTIKNHEKPWKTIKHHEKLRMNK